MELSHRWMMLQQRADGSGRAGRPTRMPVHTHNLHTPIWLDHGGQSPGVCLDEDVGFDMFSNYNLLTALRSQIDVGVRKSY